MRGEEIILSDEGSKVVTMVVPTNEELAIARETVRLDENEHHRIMMRNEGCHTGAPFSLKKEQRR